MPDFSSLVQLLDAQPAKMTDQITALNALLVLKLRMVVREKLLLPWRYVAFLPLHRCHLLQLKRIVQDVSKPVLTWTLLRKSEMNMGYHQPDHAIHVLTLPKELLTSHQWQNCLAQMMRMLHPLSLLLFIGINFLVLSSCMNSHAIPTLGKVGADCGVQVVCLCSRDIDLSTDREIDQLLDQVQATPGASIHCSIECAPWSSWQNMNIATRGPEFQKELDVKRAESRRMLMAFIRVAALIYHMGGEISFEWPRYASG